MKKEIKTINQIEAPADQVWNLLRTGQGVNNWLPIITSCRVEGNKRFCTTEQGVLNETILKSDDEAMVFQYSIPEQNLFPVSDIVGTMQLKGQGLNSTVLHWDVTFEVENEAIFQEVKNGIEGVYAMGAKGLEELAQQENSIV